MAHRSVDWVPVQYAMQLLCSEGLASSFTLSCFFAPLPLAQTVDPGTSKYC